MRPENIMREDIPNPPQDGDYEEWLLFAKELISVSEETYDIVQERELGWKGRQLWQAVGIIHQALLRDNPDSIVNEFLQGMLFDKAYTLICEKYRAKNLKWSFGIKDLIHKVSDKMLDDDHDLSPPPKICYLCGHRVSDGACVGCGKRTKPQKKLMNTTTDDLGFHF